MRKKIEKLIIENKSKNLEIEKKLIQFVEQELNGMLIGKNKWKCDITNSSWSIEQIKKEIAYLVSRDSEGVVLWIYQKRRFWQKEHWTQIAINCDQECTSTICD